MKDLAIWYLTMKEKSFLFFATYGFKIIIGKYCWNHTNLDSPFITTQVSTRLYSARSGDRSLLQSTEKPKVRSMCYTHHRVYIHISRRHYFAIDGRLWLVERTGDRVASLNKAARIYSRIAKTVDHFDPSGAKSTFFFAVSLRRSPGFCALAVPTAGSARHSAQVADLRVVTHIHPSSESPSLARENGGHPRVLFCIARRVACMI